MPNDDEQQGRLDEVRVTEERLAKLKEENAQLYDRLLRSAAELDNWKKRVTKEQDEAAVRGRTSLLLALLPAVDDLDRALKHARPDDPMVAGVQLILKQLLGVFEKYGVTRFHPAGDPFDPALHHAVEEVETAEIPAGVVARVFGHGYLMDGRLFRPALVGVSKAPPALESEAGSKRQGNGADAAPDVPIDH